MRVYIARTAPKRCSVCAAEGSFVRPRDELRLRSDTADWVTHACDGCARKLGHPIGDALDDARAAWRLR